ncbi:MAG: glutamate racemase [Prevotellaceae bacterium]|jgi:glutamate racemase|nr:glutamate racemase [Prevotellaceae bacterium]
MCAAPIGLLDSGVGGLSVWREVIRLLPDYPTVYVSDNAFCPYGPRPAEEVIQRTKKISRFLIDKGCEMIVVACNTASAAAIDVLRQTFEIPFVGIEPAVKPAANLSKSGVVGVLATQGTFKGRLYLETSKRYAAHVQIIEQVGDGLVELVEQGLTEAPRTMELLHQYIDPMIDAGADHLVLGCTHYPFLIPAIQKIAQGRIVIDDPAPAVALQVFALLSRKDMTPSQPTDPLYRFYATGTHNSIQALYGRMAVRDMASAQFFSHLNLT